MRKTVSGCWVLSKERGALTSNDCERIRGFQKAKRQKERRKTESSDVFHTTPTTPKVFLVFFFLLHLVLLFSLWVV